MGWGLDWIVLVQNRGRTFVKMVMNFRMPQGVWNFLTR